jgi:cytochrome d ubiquinol oxidase subunit II
MLEGTYLTLATVWFLLWGVLWAVYFALDGFDLGIGILMPFLARNEEEKRIMYNSVGPFWDGNEVWLIAAGGVTFAAFPFAYAVMFSWLYTPLLLLLFGLILRGVSFEFRHQVEDPTWKSVWDKAQFIGSLVPALLLGVAFANIFQGLPFNAEYVNEAGIWALLNPYGILGGVVFIAIFLEHGALWLALRAYGDLQARSQKLAETLWTVEFVAIVVFLVCSWLATDLFVNYLEMPVLFLVLALPVVTLVAQKVFLMAGQLWLAWGASFLTIVGATLFFIVGLFPALMPANDPTHSLTIHNSSSSELTLTIMLVVALIFVPLVILYQAWAYKTFAAKPVDELKY